MQIGEITKRAGRGLKRKRLGRGPGSGLGKTAGRGHKGAGSRAGWKRRGLAEGGAIPTHRRLPKRGFSNARFRVEYTVINVGTLEARYDNGASVTAESLRERGLVGHLRNPIKILGQGELTKKLVVEAARFSKSAEQKITAAGGTVKVSEAK